MAGGPVATKPIESGVPRDDIDEIIRALAESELADGLGDEALRALAELGQLRRCVAGEVVVRQDDPASHLFVLAKGRAEVTVFTDEPLYALRPGMPFGEVALIDEKPRSATVRAMEDTEIVTLPADELRGLIYNQPAIGVVLLRNLARVLCARVRAGNQQIAALETIDELREGQG